MRGAAFDKTSVGYVHGIAHQLGRLCGTPHGNANAMVLPEVLLAYGDCVHSKLANLAKLIGIEQTNHTEAELAQQFIQAVIDMRKQMDLPLKPQGLKESHIPDVVKRGASRGRLTVSGATLYVEKRNRRPCQAAAGIKLIAATH